MSLRGIDAAMTVASATDGDLFRAYVEQALRPKLQCGDVVVLDNLSAHKVAGIRERIEACGAQLLYLPPYSPDLNPIEKAWSKFKKFLRDAKARTKEALDQAVTDALKPLLRTMPPPGSVTADTGHGNPSSALIGHRPALGRARRGGPRPADHGDLPA
jgi:transposase